MGIISWLNRSDKKEKEQEVIALKCKKDQFARERAKLWKRWHGHFNEVEREEYKDLTIKYEIALADYNAILEQVPHMKPQRYI